MTFDHARARRLLPLLLCLLLGACNGGREEHEQTGQGFADLGSAASGYRHARPGQTLSFPRDHGPHPGYRIEWWYLTANLHDSDGHTYGVQWTLFRQALAPPGEHPPASATGAWQSDQMWMANAAISSPEGHFALERFARGGTGQAGVTAQPFSAWLDDWQLSATGENLTPMQVEAGGTTSSGRTLGYRLQLEASGPLVLQGDQGFSRKSPDGQGSYYYSQPFLEAEGQLRLDGKRVAVEGRAWLDREWSSQLLGGDQRGWDWFSLHLDDGSRLMAFRLRGARHFISGSWIAPDGTVTPLGGDRLSLEPLATSRVADRELPLKWRITLPGRSLELTVEAEYADQWMDTAFPYWEGAVKVSGDRAGEGYLEMTGY
ncbi:putative secreted hydrolase [Kushneria sinocarnis]|uniref:Putative secreted hydrolase n=1 Tax=Kushneria sinocarnis TaxID=595502 RepID=A0A420WX45_9GAMM|nr:lipocalin-like domain-containing protein [Kushneria sinocarnis]RKR04288.1 putative secreted hydrolase [Kushneria sinocarnis]